MLPRFVRDQISWCSWNVFQPILIFRLLGWGVSFDAICWMGIWRSQGSKKAQGERSRRTAGQAHWRLLSHSSTCIGNMNDFPYSDLVHRNSHHSSQLISIFYMKVSHHSTSNTSLNCVLKTQVKLPRGILFLSLLQKIGI